MDHYARLTPPLLLDFSHSLAVSFPSSVCLETSATQAKQLPAIQFLQKTIAWGRIACTQAVGWSKKTEFAMRSPSWIRAARSGPG